MLSNKTNSIVKILIGILSCLVCTLSPLQVMAQITVIHAGTLIDPVSGNTQNNIYIVIEGKKIITVSKDCDIPEKAMVIDLSNMTVLPGLIDCHSHLCIIYNNTPNGGFSDAVKLDLLNVTAADYAFIGAYNAKRMLEAGFTRVRDVGNSRNWVNTSLKRAIRKGLIPGPKVYDTGMTIAPFGGQLKVTPENESFPEKDFLIADTKDELLKAIRKNAHYGADWIKIIADGQRYRYSEDDIRFIVEEAGRAGLKVAAHCWNEPAAITAIKAGVASIEHGIEMSDEVLKMAKEKGVWLVGTDLSKTVLNAFGYSQLYSGIVDRLGRAHKIGVKMAFGSDVVWEVNGYDRGSLTLTLLDTWIDAGIPNANILRAMTSNTAELLDLTKVCGAIREGLDADIIATDGNPLDNIKALNNVRFVMKSGQIYKQ